MGKKTNNSLGATATNQAISGASQKKHLRSRKPKFERGEPKQGIDKKKKDKKMKRKETAATRATKRLDKIRLMLDEIRANIANIQRAKELDSENKAHIADQLKAWVTKRLEKIRLVLDEIRANIQWAKELDSETNAHIDDLLQALG